MASTKLSRTAGTPTSSKKFTISFWVKRSNIGSAGNGHIFDIYVDRHTTIVLFPLLSYLPVRYFI